MQPNALFTLALGLTSPWLVTTTDFDPGHGRLDLNLDWPSGSRFPCPSCGALCSVHDSVDKSWRHLDFFQHEAYLHARVPRVRCAVHGVVQVAVPWARPGSGFTLLFEAMVMAMVPHMAVVRIAEILRVTDQRLWRVIRFYADQVHAAEDLSAVRTVAVDETAAARGQTYVTVVADVAQGRAIFVTPDRDAATIEAFAHDLQAHGGDPGAITEVACDMSKAYISGVAQHLPAARITFDHFHLAKLVGKAVDDTRRQEQREHPLGPVLLKGNRYAVLRNVTNQSAHEATFARLISMPELNLKTGKAYRMRLAFQEAMAHTGDTGVAALTRWCRWADRCRIPQMQAVAKTIRHHWDGVTRFFTTGITTAIMESMNSRIQAARARARGYRNIHYYIAMIYLIAGKHDLTPDALRRAAGIC